MRIVGVGFNCVDVYEEPDRYYATGNSIDFAIHMKRLGIEASVVSVVGEDEYGELMKNTLKHEGIDISHLHVAQGNTAVIKMELDGNDRVHGIVFEGVMEEFSLVNSDLEFIEEHQLVHTDLFGRVISHLPRFKKDGIKIVFDFSTFLEDVQIKNILPYVDYAFFLYKNRDEYIHDYLKWAKSFGPTIVVATLGEKGSVAYDGQKFYSQGIIPVDVVNTVGAGDSFIAGFMYARICGSSVEQCLYRGAATAAEVIKKFQPY